MTSSRRAPLYGAPGRHIVDSTSSSFDQIDEPQNGYSTGDRTIPARTGFCTMYRATANVLSFLLSTRSK